MDVLSVVNPYTRSLIREIPWDDEQTVERVVEKAYSLFVARKFIPRHQRIQILERLQALIRERKDELIKQAVEEGGKPYRDTCVEFERAMEGVALAIAAIRQMKGEMIPMGQPESSMDHLAFTMLEPVGVVLAISAFNHPINLIVHQVVTAIAVGAPVIVKPALKTPLTCKIMVGLILEAGLPADYCQIIICKNAITEKLVTDRRIAYVSFIGSHRVGWHLRSILAPGSRMLLEHGGVAPVIIEKDASIDALINPLSKGAFYHAGQVCVSVQKIFVREKMLDEFLSKFRTVVSRLKTGDPMDPDTDVGPLILPQETDRIEAWVKDAESEGARVLFGGNRISEVLFEPTILINPAPYSYVSTEEVFGPVVSVYSYSRKEEAIEMANALPFSFQSAIFTKTIDRAMEYIHRLKANTVLVNNHTAFRIDAMPFAGSELSGLGTGGIYYAMKDMCKEKLVVIRHKPLPTETDFVTNRVE